MKCEHCKARVEDNLTKMNGVQEVIADVDQKSVTVTFDPAVVTPGQMQEVVEDLGYDMEV